MSKNVHTYFILIGYDFPLISLSTLFWWFSWHSLEEKILKKFRGKKSEHATWDEKKTLIKLWCRAFIQLVKFYSILLNTLKQSCESLAKTRLYPWKGSRERHMKWWNQKQILINVTMIGQFPHISIFSGPLSPSNCSSG